MSAELRAKRLIGYYGRYLFFALLVLGVLAAAGAGYVYATPPTERVTEQTEVQQVSADVRTSAVVTGNTTFYRNGQRLVDQPAYLMAATPNLTVETRVAVPSGTDVRVTQRLALVQTATRGDRPFWTSSRVITEGETTTREGSAATSATVNMSAIEDEVRRNRGTLGTIGGFETRLELNVTYDTGAYTGSLTASSPVVVSERAYWIESPLSATRTHSRPVTRTVAGESNMALVGLLGLLTLSAFASAGGVAYVRREDIDVEAIELRMDRARFKEWITTSEIPTDPDRKYVRTTSLEGLVDIAIDSNNRVLHDPEPDVYTVVTDDIVYYYATDESAMTSWFNM
ncbi:DUF5305 domain-containing protein [Halobellus sp. EA9]|uniref:DUF5305 domain-containing protein n=1 Tax=Halobellus sp. EA9 TaxID=3421647 RepID=UPI003EBA48BE